MGPAVISVRGLTKRYGALEAIRGVDFEVFSGECFGLLGPNGAGKTSIIEILEGLRPRTEGSVSVLGLDPEAASERLRDRIGVCLQATNLPDRIRVREALALFRSFYSRSADVGSLLARLALESKAEAFYQHLSGGQKQRLALALSLVNEPDLLFLDEPTAGLDPQARRAIHDVIRGARAEGKTVVLTTHYIEEAERLCDRVAIVDGGRVIAAGSPEALRARSSGAAVVEVRFASRLVEGTGTGTGTGTGAGAGAGTGTGTGTGTDTDTDTDTDTGTGAGAGAGAGAGLGLPPEDRFTMHADGLGLTLSAARPAKSIARLMNALDERGIEPTRVSFARPSLEDVFLELTGRSLRDE